MTDELLSTDEEQSTSILRTFINHLYLFLNLAISGRITEDDNVIRHRCILDEQDVNFKDSDSEMRKRPHMHTPPELIWSAGNRMTNAEAVKYDSEELLRLPRLRMPFECDCLVHKFQ